MPVWITLIAAFQATPWLLLLAGMVLLWPAMFKPLDINAFFRDLLEHLRSQQGKLPKPAPRQTKPPKSKPTKPRNPRAKKN
jgi:hypothetical protein